MSTYEVRYQFEGELVVEVSGLYGEFAAEKSAKERVREELPKRINVAPGIDLEVGAIDFQTIEVERTGKYE